MEKQVAKGNNIPAPAVDSSFPSSAKASQSHTTIELHLRHTCNQSCWKRRTFLEKALLLTVVVMTMVVIALVVITATWPNQIIGLHSPEASSKTSSSADICLSEECVRTATRMIEAMDKNIDPCDDFFEHACGTWNRVFVIPEDKSNFNTFRKLQDELQANLKVILEVPITPNEMVATKNAKHLYQSCMNTSLIEDRKAEPLLKLLDELGGWPVLNPNWNNNSFVMVDMLADVRILNSHPLIRISVGTDDKNSEVHIILLDQPYLGMPGRDYFLKQRDNKTLKAYLALAIEVAVALGADRQLAITEMTEMVEFEIQLANNTVPDENRRDTEAIYRKLNVSSLYNITQDIDWLRYIKHIFASVDIKINGSEPVVIYATKFMDNLGKLIRATPKRTLANYLLWHIVMNRIHNLPQKFVDLKRSFNKALLGTDQEQARWRVCVAYTNEHLGMAVGRMFVSRHFDENAKKNALEMIHNIRNAFSELLDEVAWMDEKTKKVARAKADAINEKIGYPDYIMNDTALNLDYEGVEINPNEYFENVLSIMREMTRRALTNLRLPVDKAKWTVPAPAVVNAYYNANKNQIMFPAGILQPPFYHGSYPKSLNFGGIAMVIGHELTHGFDDRGRQYDKHGNLKQWWSDSVIEKFKEKAQCIIDQYSNYTVKEAGMNLNGKQTQGENIADNGGLKQAFRAYTRWVERTEANEKLLPGLALTHKQLFFLNFAQIWCGTARPESAVQAIRVGRHSPGRYRVIGALSNSKDFAEAYSCPPGSKMNPVKKCSIW